MSDIAIRVQNLGKQYHIGALLKNGGHYSYKSLRDSIASAASMPIRAARSLLGGKADSGPPQDDTIWALKDVSFDVRYGEIVGVIGRNGAGKSTLLKLLSRITEPTTGRVEIHGRVGSLLEVGTGFHPELTGRDNVFLNGAILGMKRAEIAKNFDAIVAFAEVEKFIDTPVKHYSSGMYLRLAFAVAAHLQTEILIVDEVLAVGDSAFQKKCLGKMQDVSSREGRTVLFVSHNLQAVATLTSQSVLLDHGTVIEHGRTTDVISTYLAQGADNSLIYVDPMPPSSTPKIQRVELITSEADNTQINGDPLEVMVTVYCPYPIKDGNLTIQFFNASEIPVVHFWIFDSDQAIFQSAGTHTLKCTIPKCRLFLGRYTVTLYLAQQHGYKLIQQIDRVCPFQVAMFNTKREFPWNEGASTYVDEFAWEVLEQPAGGQDEYSGLAGGIAEGIHGH